MLGTVVGVSQGSVLGVLPAFVLLFLYILKINYKLIFQLTLASIPLSVQWHFSNGFSTDLPTEPLVACLSLVFLAYALRSPTALPNGFFKHPITLLVLLHLLWIAVVCCTSLQFFTSFKYFLAKMWYVIGFFVMTVALLRAPNDLKRTIGFTFFWLVVAVSYTHYKHYQHDFSFASVHKIMFPFFYNHVDYACICIVFLPYALWHTFMSKEKSFNFLLNIAGIVVLVAGIYFSYTRVAYVAFALMPIFYILIYYKLLRFLIPIGVLILLFGSVYITQQGRYMEYAPQYERTIMHHEFDDLISATARGEDVSTMERVHRWVAGMNMAAERPLLGFGPANFYTFYQAHTLHAFKTYVSDNPEKSGVHNYFLMLLIEQGVFGLVIFLILHIFALLYGERLYHRLRCPQRKRLVMAVMLSLLSISLILLINDMIENIKVGSFYFFGLALLLSTTEETE